MSNDDGELRVTVSAEPSELSGLRGRVADAARETGADDDVVADFELAVSELATNVILHTDSATLTVVMHRTPDGWVLDVSNADALHDLAGALDVDPIGQTGRGLVIAQAVMDRVELVDIDGEQHIRCFRRAG